jgi:hypothetical protein
LLLIAQARPQWDDTWQPKRHNSHGALLRDLVFYVVLNLLGELQRLDSSSGEIHPAGTAKVA